MKSTMFKNIFNNDQVICEDVRTIEVIDGVEYLVVHRPGEQRMFKMRKDALERVKNTKPLSFNG